MSDNKKVGAVILSRYNSRRLPGKALIKIKGKPVLDYIIERLEQVLPAEDIVIATSSEKSDDPIAEFAQNRKIKVYRGTLENVARRFFEAGNSQNWDKAIRINGDNIFADTNLLKSMVSEARNEDFDFISNVKNRTYPKGMSIEIVNLKWYKELLDKIEADKNYREHVTLYIYENEPDGEYLFPMNTELPEAAGIQLALDTPEDLERTKRIISTFDRPHYYYNLKEIMDRYGE
jgi:spore coat polysaccharide biosynthesis protein SpsF